MLCHSKVNVAFFSNPNVSKCKSIQIRYAEELILKTVSFLELIRFHVEADESIEFDGLKNIYINGIHQFYTLQSIVL